MQLQQYSTYGGAGEKIIYYQTKIFNAVKENDIRSPKVYLMRWNPSISSFTEEDYKECVKNLTYGLFPMNWSIREWEEARKGDFFYMLRVGDDKAGIVFRGQFLSDPYPDDDWAGTEKRRMYVDLICSNPSTPEGEPRIPMEKLQKEIPDFVWERGASGVLLSDDLAEKLAELF